MRPLMDHNEISSPDTSPVEIPEFDKLSISISVRDDIWNSRDLFHHIVYFLDCDYVGICSTVCKIWKTQLEHDAIWKNYCFAIYPAQRKKCAMQLVRWNSWYEMLRYRPRIRTNGIYYLKTSYIKKPERGMNTDIPVGTILEAIYYRHFNFKLDGTVLYCMNFEPPKKSIKQFGQVKGNINLGEYYVEQSFVYVTVPTKTAMVNFKFKIQPEYDHSVLSLLHHSSKSHHYLTQHETFGEYLHFYVSR